MTRGKFITFEGGEGAGKSTQANRLADVLRAAGRTVVLTREPGGTARAEAIRTVLFERRFAPSSALTEALLFNAARADHLDGVIRPALARGTWVICDRFMDSTRAYQGAAGGLAADDVGYLERLTVGATRPDLTLILDLDVTAGLSRAHARQARETPQNVEPDPFEARERQFHERLRTAYRAIADQEPLRCRLIDASGQPDAVHANVRAAAKARFPDEPL